MRIGISYTSEKEKEFVMTNLLKNFDRPDVTLSDLRLLGCQGEAIFQTLYKILANTF